MSQGATNNEHPCPHCSTPVMGHAPTAPFCCSGCRGAHALLTESGLSRYYTLRDAQGSGFAPPADATRAIGQSSFPWLDPLLEASPPCDGVRRLELDVQGIQCGACVWLIEQLFKRAPGALAIEVNPGRGQLSLTFRDGTFPLKARLGDLTRLGYQTGPRGREQTRGDDLLLRFGICAAIAMNGMIFSASHYLGLTADVDPQLFMLFGWLNLLLSTLALMIGGSVFIKGAARAAAMRIIHLDVPIALGMLVAYGGSAWSFLSRGSEATYFDTLQIFIALMLLGRLIQRRVIAANRRMVLGDDGIGGLVVRILQGNGDIQVRPASDVREGDRLLVAPGEVVPVAAQLQDRRADLALDWLNGEPEPQTFESGSILPAGARNLSTAALHTVAHEDFANSHLKNLLTTERVDGDRPLWGRFWDRVSRIYVVAVLGVAAVGALAWWPTSPERAIEVVVAILVVTCPCALGLATPLAYDIIQTRLRRSGLFIRRLSFLDRAVDIKKVIFDKTGTLTLGELSLRDPAHLHQLSEEAQRAIWHMSSRSNHPRSRALFETLRGMAPLNGLDITNQVTERAGEGLMMTWDGGLWRLGSPAFALESHPDTPQHSAMTVLSLDGAEVAHFTFDEVLRADARAEVDALKAMGVEVYILSGDESERVCDIAQSLGIPTHHVRSGASPDEKARFIASLDKKDTLMVGDGINDAKAFEAAFCAGTPAVDRPTLPARSDFFYLGNGLGPIAKALTLAHRTRQRILHNLALAAAYNILTISLALAGLMSPLLCAIAMPLSSVGIVLATSHSLRRPLASTNEVAPLPNPTWSPAV